MPITKYYIIILLSLFIFSCSKENTDDKDLSEVPSNVAAIFQTKYPNAQELEWRIDEGNWEAEFELDGSDYEAEFSPDGTWIKTKHKLLESDIPDNIMQTLKEDFADYSILETEMYETVKSNEYEIKIQKGGNIEIVTLDPEGTVLNVEGDDGHIEMDND